MRCLLKLEACLPAGRLGVETRHTGGAQPCLKKIEDRRQREDMNAGLLVGKN